MSVQRCNCAAGAGGGTAPPPSKRPRPAPLAGVVLFVPPKGLPHSGSVLKAWQTSVSDMGGAITQDPSSATISHCLVPQPGGGWPVLPPRLQPGSDTAPAGLRYVTQHWVTECTRKQQRVPEANYQPAAAAPPPPPPAPAGAGGGRAAAHLVAWLGPLWRPECADMEVSELMLQGDYDEERCRRIGNESLVQALKEMQRYEEALNGQFLTDSLGNRVINHKSLAYAQAAAVVRTCAYRLKPPLEAGKLPYLAGSTTADVNEILLTGTCDKLEHFRRDEAVRNSKGVLRTDSAGAATRRKFTKLLGVGSEVARKWWDAGLRAYEDVEAAAVRGGPGGWPALNLTPMQLFGLEHRADLLEGLSSEDLVEMRRAVEEALVEVTGVGGWLIENVGGSRRQQRSSLPQQEPQVEQTQARDDVQALGKQQGQQQGQQQNGEENSMLHHPTAGPCRSGEDSATTSSAQGRLLHHDADFLVCHPTYLWDESLIVQLRDELIKRRWLVPPERGAMCQMQRNRTRDLEQQVLWEMTEEPEKGIRGNIESDRCAVRRTALLDHVFAVFRTTRGKMRRLDIILAIPAQLPFALIGWIGSTQFTRFLRRFVKNHHMHLNNHGLYRIIDGRLARVPDDALPLDRRNVGRWPPGWGPDSGATGASTDADVGAAASHNAADEVGGGQAVAAAAAAAEGAAGLGSSSRWAVRSQRDIFDLLGLPYREPYQRDCP